MRKRLKRIRNEQLIALMISIEKEKQINNKDTFKIKDFFVSE